MKQLLAKAMPSIRATGVRFTRLVTSPMAQTDGTLVRLKSSTLRGGGGGDKKRINCTLRYRYGTSSRMALLISRYGTVKGTVQ